VYSVEVDRVLGLLHLHVMRESFEPRNKLSGRAQRYRDLLPHSFNRSQYNNAGDAFPLLFRELGSLGQPRRFDAPRRLRLDRARAVDVGRPARARRSRRRRHDLHVVRLRAHRWTRRVLEITVVEPGRARQLLDLERAESTEGLITEPMGIAPPGRRRAGGAALLPAAGNLLTIDEVSRAVGQRVTARPGPTIARPAPLSLQLYEVNGRGAVHVAVTTGRTARLALRARHAGTPLSGLGDEAYLGDHWAIARSGENAVTVQVDPGVGPLPPGHLPWLLWTAAGRLPAQQPCPDLPDASGR